MNSVLESSYAWTGSFVEALQTLTCDIANVVYESLGLTLNSSDSEASTSTDTSTSTSTSASSESSASDSGSTTPPAAESAEGVVASIVQFFQGIFEALFTFSDFEFLLLQIFLAILVGNICLIYLAWYIYGERIGERFMTPTDAEELKKNVSKLKLPKEHSQRHS